MLYQSPFLMHPHTRYYTIATVLCLLIVHTGSAQPPLERKVTITANHVPLEKVLQEISTKANFYFAYNSSIIKTDSIVSLSINNRPVTDVLFALFQSNLEYKSSGNYVILRRAPAIQKAINEKAVRDNTIYYVTGYVSDDSTGAKVKDASVYVKERLVSTLTNDNGYFRLRLKNTYSKTAVTVSKVEYIDTTFLIDPRYNRPVNIAIVPVYQQDEIVTISPEPGVTARDTVPEEIAVDTFLNSENADFSRLEQTPLGRFFATSVQRIQSLNLGNYIAQRPYQVSLIPGISTHGKLSANVVNNASLNILGGYTAGVNGGEAGSLFNMNKRNMEGAQVAGLFNLTGGYVSGVQGAGIFNLVLGDVKGVQLAGITNNVYGKLNGVQLSGIYNHTSRSSGGIQVAGVGNFSGGSTSGIQIGGIINYAKKLHGVQIGLINISDSSSGFSIGLINVVLKGYHKLSLYSNESLPLNAAFKTGNTNLYSILLGGINVEEGKRQYSFGYGLGTERRLGKTFSINPELSSQYIYQGSWHYTNLLNKLSLNINIHAGKYFSVFAGPSLNVFYSNQATTIHGFQNGVAGGYHKFSWPKIRDTNGWIGWNAGISIF
jgi:hypothetical protein